MKEDAAMVVNPKKQESMIRVLLVEDNPGDARLIQELLAEDKERFEMDTVETLADARELLSTFDYRLVMLDLSLPDSRGIETFHSIAELVPNTPLIVLSGLDDEAMALQTVKEGAQDYLVKGLVDRRTLVRAMRYALKRAEAERALEEERNLLRSVVDNLLDSIYVKDLQGRYLFDNLAHMRSLGAKSPEEVVGKSVFDFFPEATAMKFHEDDRMVLRTGKPILNREEVIVNGPAAARWVSTTKVPLRDSGGMTSGVVGIGRDITERKQAEEQLYRYTAEIRQRNAELEDDLHMAREIQQAFLPQQYPTFPRKASPEESALRFCSRYIPTATVGGDFFHILPVSDAEAGIFICDVMGHGVRAALVTAMQRALVEEMLPVADDPGRFLTEINRALLSILRRARTPMFASAFYLVVDVAKGVVRYANAGHPRPLHLRRSTGSIDFLNVSSERPGPALGVFKDITYETKTTQVLPGDLLLLFTDGLFEVEGADNVYFDQEKLMEIVGRHLNLPIEQLIDQTIADMQEFAAEHTFSDDVCLVGVEVDRLEPPDESAESRE